MDELILLENGGEGVLVTTAIRLVLAVTLNDNGVLACVTGTAGVVLVDGPVLTVDRSRVGGHKLELDLRNELLVHVSDGGQA